MCTPGVFPGPSPNTKPIITALKPKPPPPLAPKPRPKSVGGGGDRGSGNNLDIFGEPLFWNDLWVNIWRHIDHTFELGTIVCGLIFTVCYYFLSFNCWHLSYDWAQCFHGTLQVIYTLWWNSIPLEMVCSCIDSRRK